MREIGTVTIVITEEGYCRRTLAELVEHVDAAMREGRDAGPLRYSKAKVISAELNKDSA